MLVLLVFMSFELVSFVSSSSHDCFNVFLRKIDDLINSVNEEHTDEYRFHKLENVSVDTKLNPPHLHRYRGVIGPLPYIKHSLEPLVRQGFADESVFSELLMREKYDIIHLHTLPKPELKNAILDLKKDTNARLIYSPHDILFLNKYYDKNGVTLNEELMAKADTILVGSDFEKEYIKENYETHSRKTKVFPLASGLEELFKKYSVLDYAHLRISELVGDKNDDFAIGYVGPIEKCNGLDGLVDAFKMLSDHEYPVKLYLLGRSDKGYEKHLKEKLKGYEGKYMIINPMHDPVFLNASGLCEGEASDPELRDRLALASYHKFFDLFVMPSYGENGIFSTLDSLLAGTPALVADSGRTESLFIDKGYAKPIANPENPFEIAGKIVEIMNNRSWEKSQLKKVSENLKKEYSQDNLRKFYPKLFKGSRLSLSALR